MARLFRYKGDSKIWMSRDCLDIAPTCFSDSNVGTVGSFQAITLPRGFDKPKTLDQLDRSRSQSFKSLDHRESFDHTREYMVEQRSLGA